MATSDEPGTPQAPAPREQPRENVGQRRVGRGAFLGVVGLGVGTLFAGSAISRATRSITQPVTDSVGLAGVIPSGGWRIYTVAASMPTFDPVTWRLQVAGLVDTPLTLTYDQLRALPRTDQVSKFHCVTGWVVTGVKWGGVRLEDVLKLARPQQAATAMHLISSERPYVDSLTRKQAALQDVLLAYELDGKPLPRAHGAPLRLVIPEMYGYKSVKWVERIELVANPSLGYWEQRGYDTDAWIGRSNGDVPS